MAGYRWRNMYYLTGLPGWMRFGFSPGWIGRSPAGLPPAAQYLTQTGTDAAIRFLDTAASASSCAGCTNGHTDDAEGTGDFNA